MFDRATYEINEIPEEQKKPKKPLFMGMLTEPVGRAVDISRTAGWVYLAIAHRCVLNGKTVWSNVSDKDLALFRCTRYTLRRYLPALVEAGLVEKECRGQGHKTYFRVKG